MRFSDSAMDRLLPFLASTSMPLVVGGFLALVAIPTIPAISQSCDPLPRSGVIDKPGYYCLRRDMQVDRNIGIDISSSDVVLDLQAFEIAKSDDADGQLSFGVRITGPGTVRGVTVRNGKIRGFVVGVKSQGPNEVILENLEIRDSGAIAIDSESDGAKIRRNRIEGVRGRPLDANQAYAIGVNLGGKDVSLEDNVIMKVYRQNKPAEITGEAVGILIRSDCHRCQVNGNIIRNEQPDGRSIGIWNAGTGRVDIARNSISSFENGIVALGREYMINNNAISCGPRFELSVGVTLVLPYEKGKDVYGGSFNNSSASCVIETFQCFGGCYSHVYDAIKKAQGPQIELYRPKPKN